ncbi:hypothetical protein L208DRAFT_1283897 [Tricholoma matsutake]|nr:hypothetical protein L208DRAFT_1283897 [Tricholoma matsutake 945]
MEIRANGHQSYYTALSRGTSAAGTLITQPFHPQKITGGASGALRQEFRELELLDEITDLLYNSRLHRSVIGEQRNILIASFRLWKCATCCTQSYEMELKRSFTRI